jgi:fatty acid desaturase
MSGRSSESLLRYPADRLNVLRVASGLPLFLLPAVTGVPRSLLGVGYVLLLWFMLNDMNFLLHQHVHCRVFSSRWLNAAYAGALSIMTGVSGSSWRQQHVLRHHEMDDRWGHAFDWEFRRKSRLGLVSYSVRGAPIIVAWAYADTVRRGLLGRQREPIDFRLAFLGQTLTLAVAALLMLRTPIFYAPFYVTVWIFTKRTDYDNHAGCDESPLGFANNTIDERYNWVRNNFGYHTAHHLHPSAHWTELPALHAVIAAQIPPERIEPIGVVRMLNPGLIAYYLSRTRRMASASPGGEVARPGHHPAGISTTSR